MSSAQITSLQTESSSNAVFGYLLVLPKMRDDPEANVRFCKLIESHPALYDSSHPHYINNLIQAEAWESIAKELGEKDINECKKWWKNIRNRYAKFKKSKKNCSGSAAKKLKEYYLAPHLQFVDNFLKERKGPKFRSKYTQATDEITRDTSQSDDCESDGEEPREFMWASPPSTSPVSSPQDIKLDSYPPSLSPSSGGSIMKTKSPNRADQNQSALEYFTAKQNKANELVNTHPPNTPLYFIQGLLPPPGDLTNPPKRTDEILVDNFTAKQHKANELANTEPLDPDISFLQSLLPDMRAMNLAQKRRFKIGVMELAGEILDENGEMSTAKKSRWVETTLKARLARKRPIVVSQKLNLRGTGEREDDDVET